MQSIILRGFNRISTSLKEKKKIKRYFFWGGEETLNSEQIRLKHLQKSNILLPTKQSSPRSGTKFHFMLSVQFRRSG